MKTLKSILYAFIAVFVLAGCDDDGDYLTGAPEDPDCYNVYFPAQDNAKDQELDPAAETKLSFIARRTNSEGAISVPVSVKPSHSDIFTFSTIQFADGQEETTFDVTFPNTEVGTKYSCEVNIEDPKYAALYGEKSTGLNFSVTRVKWNQVFGDNGEELATWNEVLIGLIFTGGSPQQGQCRVFERDDRKGYYRFENPYNKGLVDAMFGTGAYERYAWEANVIVDARDPEKVFIPAQEIGLSVNRGTANEFGSIKIASAVSDNFTSGGSDANYGKLADGVMSFPKGSIYASMALYNDGAYSFTNSEYVTNLVLPGAKVYDYTLALTKSEPENGVVKLGFALGTDVAKVRYAFFEGSLSEALAETKSKEMDGGELPVKELTATGTVNAVMEETGMYTVLGNIYNEADELQGYQYLSFGYIKAGDEKPVLMSVGLNITDKYASKGYTAEDSAEFWANGQEIESGYYGLYETDALAGATEEKLMEQVVSDGKEFTSDDLESINKADGSFSVMIGGLNGGTEHTLVVLAYNGYVSKLLTAQATTEGTPHPLKRNYAMTDFMSSQLSKTAMCKTWNYYAGTVSNGEKSGKRAKIGTVTIADNTTADTADEDFLNISGLSGIARFIGGDDTMLIEYYNGVLYFIPDQIVGAYNGSPVSYWMTTTTLGGYSANYALLGGQVVDGYLAFVANPQHISVNKLTFDGIRFLAFSDESLETATAGLNWYYNLMLEDPDKAVPMSAPAVKVSTLQLERISKAYSEPQNYVELRGRERMRALIDEYAGKDKSPANLAQPTLFVERSGAKAVSAEVTFTKGIAPRVSEPIQVIGKKADVEVK